MSVVLSYLIATRPWSLTAGVMPVLVTAAAIDRSLSSTPFWETGAFYAVLAVIVLVQMAANLTNTYHDFRNKVDTPDSFGDPTLIHRKRGVTPNGVWFVSVLLYAVAAALAVYLTPTALAVFAVGGVLSYFYTGSPLSLKYYALGDVVIFLCFGPLLVSYTALVLSAALAPGRAPRTELGFTMRYCTPLALYTEAILHANNTRDITADTRAGCRTVASILGLAPSRTLYALLLLGAHISALYLAATEHWGAAATLLVAPSSLSLVRGIYDDTKLGDVTELTAQTHLLFGLLLFAGIYTTDSP